MFDARPGGPLRRVCGRNIFGGLRFRNSAAEPVQETREAQPLVVNVGAAACVPCRLMAPVLERAALRYEGRARVLVVDIRTNRDALKTYGVRVLPTQIFFNAAGERVATHEGFLSEAELTRAIDELVAIDD